MSDISLRPCRGEQEFPALVAVWRSAVDATHDFLEVADRDAIEAALASEYFPSVLLTVATVDDRPVGFSGVVENRLEMLFVEDAARGRGVGSALLARAVESQGVTEVDVNEQNPPAVGFYLSKGFEVAGRSELDESGRPYPLLHLRYRGR